MSTKTYEFVVGITSGVAAIASACVVFFEPPYQEAIAGSIPLIAGCITGVAALFIKKDA